MNKSIRDVLIISSQVFNTPPVGYGGIERIGALAFEEYSKHGYSVDIVSNNQSSYHTFSIEEVTRALISKYKLVISYDYNQELLRILNNHNAAHVILQNTFKPKLKFMAGYNNLHLYALSEASRKQYMNGLNKEVTIIPNGINLGVFKNSNYERMEAIIYIGGFGMHKSPLACLRYAKAKDLHISFYGLPIYRDDEKLYEDNFYKELSNYRYAELNKEINDSQKVELLNTYKYFIFLPGIDKATWVEPFGIAPLEAMACGCTVITQFEVGGHLDFCKEGINSISYKKDVQWLNPPDVRKSIELYDFSLVWETYYPK